MIEFNKLIKKSLSDYQKYLINKSHGDFEKLLHQNQVDAYKNFIDLIALKKDPDILQKISNPFYLGMGNPKSKILIFGQELAIELNINKQSSLDSFFQEQLYHHKLLIKPESSFFDPYRANNFRKIKLHSHTWGIYSKWVAAFKENESKKYKKYLFDVERKDFFEDNCFYTELYDVPSPKHLTSKTTTERENFFKSKEFRDFLSTFDYILIGCTSFYNDYHLLLDKYLGVNKINIKTTEELFHLNKKGKPYIKGELLKTKSNQKFAIFSNQFSSAWSYNYINEIVKKLNKL